MYFSRRRQMLVMMVGDYGWWMVCVHGMRAIQKKLHLLLPPHITKVGWLERHNFVTMLEICMKIILPKFPDVIFVLDFKTALLHMSIGTKEVTKNRTSDLCAGPKTQRFSTGWAVPFRSRHELVDCVRLLSYIPVYNGNRGRSIQHSTVRRRLKDLPLP